jgi:multidrug efflux system outer membrane protein
MMATTRPAVGDGLLPARALLLAALLSALAGCTTPPTDLQQAAAPPADWRTPSTTTTALSDRPWGDLFRSPDLDALINEALANNTDLLVAVQRVEVARAQYGFTRSFLFPAIGAQADYTRSRRPAGEQPPNVTTESSGLGLVVPTWEIDLFGRLQAATEAQRRSLLASEDTRWAVYISLIGAVSRSYLRLLDLDNQSEVARRQIEARRESLRVVAARHKAGVSAGSDLRQAESNLAQADAASAAIERQRTQAENALAVLIGRNPGPIRRPTKAIDTEQLALLPAGLPSQLLTRRPDILAAEQTVRASEANLDAAKRAYFPTISLTGFLGFASPALRDLFDDGRGAWSVAPAISLPIFTWGRLSANVEQAEAQQKIAVEQYRQTVRTAFKEVDDALVAYQRNIEQRDALARAVRADRERARLAELRYRNGVTIYLEVLIAQQDAFESELRLSNASRDVYESVVDLYVALGGGWEPPATTPAGGAAATGNAVVTAR